MLWFRMNVILIIRPTLVQRFYRIDVNTVIIISLSESAFIRISMLG